MKEAKKVLTRLFWITIGQFVGASGYTLVLSANGLVPNALGGVAQNIHRMTGLNVQLLLACLALPIFIWAFFCYDKKQILYALYSFSMFTFYTGIVGKFMPEFHSDMIVVVVVGGIIQGSAAGIIMKQHVANGPEAIVAMYLKKKTGLTIGTFFLILNAIVIGSSILYGDLTIIIYSLMCTFLQSKVTDFWILGFEKYYSVTVMSDNYLEITQFIRGSFNRTVTFTQGMDTDNVKKRMIVNSVVTKPELMAIREYIASFEDDSFVYAEETNMVLGKGIDMQG